MREPPINLLDDDLKNALHSSYRLAVTEFTFLDLGADSRAWVYLVHTTSGDRYFLKVRQSIHNAPSLHVTHFLHDHDVSNVMAPLPTTSQMMWAEVSGYSLILYPFIEGGTGKIQGMSKSQWIVYGKTLRQIHETSLPTNLVEMMNRETFLTLGASMVRDIDAFMQTGNFEDAAAQELAPYWQENRTLIHTLVQRVEELGHRLAQTSPVFVLCHADIHTNNVMIDPSGEIWIVDWDETVLAPRERDLMFVLSGGISRKLVSPDNEELFMQGYGETTMDALALAYYRYAWAINDIGEYGTQVVLRPDLGPQSRKSAVGSFKFLFLPGNIVDIAVGSEF